MSTQPKGTPSYPEFVRKLFNRSGDPSKDFSHAILGVATEAHEYEMASDRVNAIEELGDGIFYLEALEQVINDHLASQGLAPIDRQDILLEASRAAGAMLVHHTPYVALQDAVIELLDAAKRWVGYGREPASLNAILVLSHVAFKVSRDLGLVPHTDATESHIRAVNMAKLLKRYPGGDFDAFRALQRDLGAERATLESAVLG